MIVHWAKQNIVLHILNFKKRVAQISFIWIVKAPNIENENENIEFTEKAINCQTI